MNTRPSKMTKAKEGPESRKGISKVSFIFSTGASELKEAMWKSPQRRGISPAEGIEHPQRVLSFQMFQCPEKYLSLPRKWPEIFRNVIKTFFLKKNVQRLTHSFKKNNKKILK